MKTRIFAHKGIIGIESSLDAEGLINDPSAEGQLGFIVRLDKCLISDEALKLLKTIKKSGDDLSEINLWRDETGIPFIAWMGGPLTVVDPSTALGQNDYNPNMIDGPGGAEIVKNAAIIDRKFVEYVEGAYDENNCVQNPSNSIE